MEKSDKTDEKREKREEQITRDEKIKESGQVELFRNSEEHKLYLLSIIGEIEGHECLASTTKTTKYEHVLPKLAEIEDAKEIAGRIRKFRLP